MECEFVPGMKVVVHTTGLEDNYIATVSRVTSTRCFVRVNEGCETAYRKKDGREVGGTAWSRSWISRATSEEVERIGSEQKRKRLAARLRDTAFRTLPLDVLEEVCAVLDRETPGEKP